MPFSCTVLLDDVIKGLEKEKEASEKVLERTVGDVRSRGPGWISKAVREEYSISAKDVKEFTHVEKAGSFSLAGKQVDNVAIVYRGRPLTYTHFKIKPTKRPASGKPYSITVEVKKGNRKELHGKSRWKGKPFLAPSGNAGTKHIPFQREGDARLPIQPNKTLSVPQMVQDGNGNTKPKVEEALNDGIKKRFDHYLERYLKK